MTYDVREAVANDAELLALKNAAIAEANGTSLADNNVTVTEEVNTPGEVLVVEEAAKDEVPAEEPTNEEPTQEVVEIDKDKKKHLYAKIGKTEAENQRLKRELEELRKTTSTDAYDADSLSTIRSIIRAEILESEINATGNSERKEFIAKTNVDAQTIADIESIKEAHPSLSYDAAHKLYLAYNPDLIPQARPQPKQIMKGNSVATAPIKNNDAENLERLAREELKKMMAV